MKVPLELIPLIIHYAFLKSSQSLYNLLVVNHLFYEETIKILYRSLTFKCYHYYEDSDISASSEEEYEDQNIGEEEDNQLKAFQSSRVYRLLSLVNHPGSNPFRYTRKLYFDSDSQNQFISSFGPNWFNNLLIKAPLLRTLYLGNMLMRKEQLKALASHGQLETLQMTLYPGEHQNCLAELLQGNPNLTNFDLELNRNMFLFQNDGFDVIFHYKLIRLVLTVEWSDFCSLLRSMLPIFFLLKDCPSLELLHVCSFAPAFREADQAATCRLIQENCPNFKLSNMDFHDERRRKILFGRSSSHSLILEDNLCFLQFSIMSFKLFEKKIKFDQSLIYQEQLQDLRIRTDYDLMLELHQLRFSHLELPLNEAFHPVVQGCCIATPTGKKLPPKTFTMIGYLKEKWGERKVECQVWNANGRELQMPYLDDEFCLQQMLQW